MKKNLLLIGLVLALSLSATAQYKGFTFGFKAGPNVGWAGSSTNTAHAVGARAGGDIGFIAEYYFTDNYAIVTGVNVSFLGGRYTFENGRMVTSGDSIPVSVFQPFQVDRTYKTTLYELPIMLKLVTNDLGAYPIRVYAQVGAGVGYNHKVLVKDGIDGGEISETWEKTNKEFSNLRVALKIGAGVEYAIDDNLRIFGGFYYSHDFVNHINWVSPNYAGYYIDPDGEAYLDANGDKIKRDPKLNLLHNRVGFEVGVLF